jgi:hypothetical protein
MVLAHTVDGFSARLDLVRPARALPNTARRAARVNNLIAKMTLDEKVGQLNQVNVDKTNLEQAMPQARSVQCSMQWARRGPTNYNALPLSVHGCTYPCSTVTT